MVVTVFIYAERSIGVRTIADSISVCICSCVIVLVKSVDNVKMKAYKVNFSFEDVD